MSGCSRGYKHVLASLGTVLACLALLAACSFDSDSPKQPRPPEQGTPAAQATPDVEMTPGEVTCPAQLTVRGKPLPAASVWSGGGILAPSYAEIKRNIDLIMKWDVYPEGPPRYYEGLADPDMNREFGCYMNSLRGKIVTHWRGAVRGFFGSTEDHNGDVYRFALVMDAPTLGNGPVGGVMLYDVPYAQIQKLRFVASNEAQPKQVGGGYRAIEFDGVIAGGLDNGVLYINQGSIRSP